MIGAIKPLRRERTEKQRGDALNFGMHCQNSFTAKALGSSPHQEQNICALDSEKFAVACPTA